MALSTGLPVSRYVSVSVSLTSPAIAVQAVNTCCVVTSDTFIDAGERARMYSNIGELARDIRDAGLELTGNVSYEAADVYFSQSPRPDHLLVGRWVREAAPASLLCAILPPQEQDMNLWSSITNGAFQIDIGGTVTAVGPLNFSTQTTMNGIADQISTALGAGANCKWAAQRFVFTSTATGPAAEIGYLLPPTTGMDISGAPTGLLGAAPVGLRGTTTTADRLVTGMAPETALSAVVAIDAHYSSNFYAIVVPEADDNAQLEIAAYVEAADPVHYLGITTMDTNVLDSVHTSDLASQLKDFSYNKTAVQFSTRNPYAVLSYLARILSTQWGGSNTVPTLMYKVQPGVHIEQISSYEADTLMEKNCNVYTGVANGANITQYGVSSSGEWTDIIIGADALALDVQQALFYAMYNTGTKIPQTDFGMNILINRASAMCSRYVINGYLAPGVWNAPGFGVIQYGDILPLGYYIYAQSMGDQDPNERANRVAPLIQIAAKAAGAIHTADVVIFVNQ